MDGVARWPSGIACVWLRGWVCAWLQGASGRGLAHAARPFAVLRGEAGCKAIVRLLAKLPAITASAPDLHARCKGARMRVILRAWPAVRACCWSCRSAILPCGPGCAIDARGGGRSFCCVPLVYQPVPGSSQRGECSRQSQGLGCDPRIQCSGRTLQARHRVNLESSGWHTWHPKFSCLLAELGQVAHGRIFEKKRHVSGGDTFRGGVWHRPTS